MFIVALTQFLFLSNHATPPTAGSAEQAIENRNLHCKIYKNLSLVSRQFEQCSELQKAGSRNCKFWKSLKPKNYLFRQRLPGDKVRLIAVKCEISEYKNLYGQNIMESYHLNGVLKANKMTFKQDWCIFVLA